MLFRPTLGQEWCEKCILQDVDHVERVEQAIAEGYKLLAEIVERTGLKQREIERVLRHLPLVRDEVVTGRSCARCRTNDAQVGFDICLPCRQSLFEAFGKMSKQISKQMVEERLHPPPPVTKVAKGLENAASGIERRRDRNFSNRAGSRYDRSR